jgi:hypothetical protein
MHAAASFGAECVLFGSALYGLGKASEHTDFPAWGWRGFAVLVAAWVLIGALPLPWPRTPIRVGVAALLVPFTMLAVIYWAFERMPIVPSWREFPRVLLAPKNIMRALLLCVAAVSGHTMTKRAGQWAGRRTSGCS